MKRSFVALTGASGILYSFGIIKALQKAGFEVHTAAANEALANAQAETGAAYKSIEDMYKSNGIENYLGEWHSHPENRPTPSHVDRSLMRQIIKDGTNVFKKVFLIIVGKDQSLYIGVTNSEISNEIYTSLIRSFL